MTAAPEKPTPAPRTASTRTATVERTTGETAIACTLDLDGAGATDIATGVGFLDHMLDALARHARFDLRLRCSGDLKIDDHHTAEDCAIALGTAIDRALGDRVGIERFGSAHAPLDEALARAVVDLVTRPHATVNAPFVRQTLGDLSCEMIPHVLESIAINGRFTLHADLLRGDNDHHKAEACFKATALALRQAVRPTGDDAAPSTKGVM